MQRESPQEHQCVWLLATATSSAPCADASGSGRQSCFGDTRKRLRRQELKCSTVSIEPGDWNPAKRIKVGPLLGVQLQVGLILRNVSQAKASRTMGNAFAYLPADFAKAFPSQTQPWQGPTKECDTSDVFHVHAGKDNSGTLSIINTSYRFDHRPCLLLPTVNDIAFLTVWQVFGVRAAKRWRLLQ